MERVTPPRRVALICGLLLLASAINYMDRQTLATVGKRITDEFTLSERQYGTLEKSFGFAFAAGSMAFGVLADRVSVRWLYPVILFLWSGVGFLTGYAESYDQLVWCRGLLGFFEAGHWPCGLKATQRLLDPGRRAMGNGVLQSGTSIGAIVIPLVMLATLTPEPGSWRFGFRLVGAAGLLWIVAWFAVVRRADFSNETTSGVELAPAGSWWIDLFSRRMLVVVLMISLMNATWQTLRAWLPKILQQEYGYDERFTSLFTSGWYVATDVGCLGSGAIVLLLIRRGIRLTVARSVVFGVCAILCLTLCLLPFVGRGPVVLVAFLAAGAGALGLFPIYYAFSQDVSRHHQGKVAGVTGVIAWLLSGQTAEFFGMLADAAHSFRPGLAVAGALPLASFFVILLLWPRDPSPAPGAP